MTVNAVTALEQDVRVSLIKCQQAIKIAREALVFYGSIKYSDKWGVPVESQWVAENAIGIIDKLSE